MALEKKLFFFWDGEKICCVTGKRKFCAGAD